MTSDKDEHEYRICKAFSEGKISKWEAVEACDFIKLSELMDAMQRHQLPFFDGEANGTSRAQLRQLLDAQEE